MNDGLNGLNGLNSGADVLGAASGCCCTCTIAFGTLNDHAGLECFAVWIPCLWAWIGTIGLLETSDMRLVCVWSMTGFARQEIHILVQKAIPSKLWSCIPCCRCWLIIIFVSLVIFYLSFIVVCDWLICVSVKRLARGWGCFCDHTLMCLLLVTHFISMWPRICGFVTARPVKKIQIFLKTHGIVQ